MRLYNTLTNKKEDFIPLEENKVKMYVCGLTVYDYMHIGNARPYIVFDTVRRYFEYKGYDVNFVQNFTDIDDKIIAKAKAENVLPSEIAEKYIEAALKDEAALNVKEATVNPRVTNEMEEIISMIKTLIEKEYAYEKKGSVYFNTRKFKDYGKLSGKNIDELEAGSRVAIDEEKRNPSDFILWKPKKDGEPFWNSPWGEGRAGWHIECSAMAKKYLGDTIDIHAGGEDLIFPHHENEIAQSEASNEKRFANYWMHNRFLNIDNEKMSKSKGKFFTVRDVLKKFSPEVVRFFMLSSHYRSPINFSEDLIVAAKNGYDRIKTGIQNLDFIIQNVNDTNKLNEDEEKYILESNEFIKKFEIAMDDDFNTADGISSIFELVRFTNTVVTNNSSKEIALDLRNKIIKLCEILGIVITNNEDLKGSEEIETLIKERTIARENKDWKKADEIRDKLNELNVIIEDTPLGVRWSYKLEV